MLIFHGHSIIPFITLFSLIFGIANGVGIGRKGPALQKRRNEDLEADRAINRTLAKMSTDGEHGRFVLLVCKGKCLRERADIPTWIREFNEIYRQNRTSIIGREQMAIRTNGTEKPKNNQNETLGENGELDEADPALGFYFHFYKKPFPRVDIEKALSKIGGGKRQQQSQQSVVAFYVVGGRLFPMGERVGRKDKLMKWLASFEQPKIQVLEDAEIGNWLNSEKCHPDGENGSVKRRRDDQTVLLVVHDPELCPETMLPNLARSFVNNAEFIVLELRKPLTEDDDFLLHWRLQNSLSDNCRMDILLRSQFFVELPESIFGSELHKIVHNLSKLLPPSSNCTNLDAERTFGLERILGPLNPIEMEFLRDERHLNAIEHNRQYLIVGTIGGVAVLAMAMSIFWGLNGNDFVPKQQ